MLGSLPGEASLEARQYYAHPRNAFWRLMSGVIDKNLIDLDYEERLAALQNARVGLWDVIASARRKGSLDASIRNPQAVSLEDKIADLPNLRALAFNGGKAARLGRRILADTQLRLIDLPSSSPAHARPLSEKASAWSVLKAVLAD